MYRKKKHILCCMFFLLNLIPSLEPRTTKFEKYLVVYVESFESTHLKSYLAVWKMFSQVLLHNTKGKTWISHSECTLVQKCKKKKTTIKCSACQSHTTKKITVWQAETAKCYQVYLCC